jgi:quercetin dioxygenase-like cupin family protein
MGRFLSKRPKEIIMRAGATAWVLGHKVRLLETDESYGLIEVTSPPKVPGPPAHYHKSEREFFLIVKGALDVMTDGVWQTMRAGSYVELPPGSVHTFINNTAEDVVWVTGWRPKGFQKFFDVFGIPVDQDRARERSLSKEVVHQVRALRDVPQGLRTAVFFSSAAGPSQTAAGRRGSPHAPVLQSRVRVRAVRPRR